MKKIFLSLLVSIVCIAASQPPIAYGPNNTLKTFTSGISFNDKAYIQTGTADPTSSPTTAPKGSIYLRLGATNGLYLKNDNGRSTNWTLNDTSTATSANTPNTIVKRGASGEFSAGTITANVTGNVTGNVSGSSGSFTGNLVGDVAGTQGATSITGLARSKLASGTASQVVINDGSGVLSSEAQLAKSRGGTGYDLTTQALELPSISTPSTPSAGFGKAYFKSDGQLYQLNDAGAETAVGSGATSANGNLVTNSTFDTNATGWTTYADGTATPGDGTGGSPTATFARTTSSPITGAGSGLFTPGSLGDGVAYTFTQTSAFVRPLQISFSYNIGSYTNYTDGDMGVWLYDVTNSQLINVTPYKILKANGTGTWQGTFQTSATGVSYRLIVNQVTATSTYTMKIDDVVISPQLVTQGVPVLDWQDFTPTGSYNTNTTYSGKWRRVGDSMEVSALVTFSGAPNNVGFAMNIPSGYAIDTTKLNASTVRQNNLGNFSIFDNSVGSDGILVGYVSYATTTSIQAYAIAKGTDNGAALVSATSPLAPSLANATTYQMLFTIPIVGWSSNSVLSVPSIDRIIVADAYYSTAATVSLTNGADNVVNLVTTRFDSTGAITLGSDSFTAPVSGYYKVSAYARLAGAAVYVYAYAGIGGVSSSATLLGTVLASVADNNYTFAPRIIYLTAGQTVTYILNPAGASVTYDNPTGMQIERVTGPQQILSGMTVAAKYTGADATVIGTTATTIKNATRVYDTTASYNTSTGEFVVPVAGVYQISFNIESDGSQGGTTFIDTYLYVDGVAKAKVGNNITQSAFGANLAGSTSIYCIPGQALTLRPRFQTAGIAYNNASATWVTFTKVGN